MVFGEVPERGETPNRATMSSPEAAPLSPEAEFAAPMVLLPELPLPELPRPALLEPVVPKAVPDALPVVPDAPVRLEDDDPAACDRPDAARALAAPDDPPAPLEPVADRPEASAAPEDAVPAADAEPDAPPPLVDPDD